MTGRRHYNPRPVNALGRRANTVGYSFVHIAIDDCTRLAYAEALPDEKAASAIAFLRRALAFYRRHGRECPRICVGMTELERHADEGHAEHRSERARTTRRRLAERARRASAARRWRGAGAGGAAAGGAAAGGS
jgi:hypothetical protein